MKKFWLIAVILIIMFGGAVYFLATNRPGTDPAPISDGLIIESDDGAASNSQYVDYAPNVIANTAGTKILFFHAPWCPQCRALESSIKAGQIPEDVTIIKVDYDSNQQLRQRYGVTIQTTLVKVDDNGKLVERYVAYDEPTLQSVIDNLL